VTAPGSSTHFFVLYLMTKAGLSPSDATFIGVGGGPEAVAALKSGAIDAISNLDPVITRLQEDGAIRIVTDSRFPRVNYQIFGGTQSGSRALREAGVHRGEPQYDAGAGDGVL